MHTTAIKNASLFKENYIRQINDKIIIEIGSQNVNGSIRDIFNGCKQYIGVDYVGGKGVDVILNEPYKLPFQSSSVDVVVCSSVFEHVEFFWLLFLEIIRVLRADGVFYLNAPSNGSFHRYPVDSWRFYPDAGITLAKWAVFNNYNTVLLESYVSKQENEEWNDFVAVFLKDGDHKDKYDSRITKTYLDFNNGAHLNCKGFLNYSAYTEDQMKINDSLNGLNEELASQEIVESTKVIKANFLFSAFLERPAKVSKRFPLDSTIQGWAVPNEISKKINLLIVQDEITRALSFNVERPDVVRKICPGRNIPENFKLGFKYSITNSEAFKIGLECNGDVIWIFSREKASSR